MEEKIEITIKFGNLESKFVGNLDEVMTALFQFLAKIPSFDILSKITLSTDFEKVLKDVEGIIASTPEGIVLLVPREQLSDREAVLLHLLKTYIGYMLGKLDKDSLSTAELLTMTGTTPGAVAGRLSELVNEGLVMRVGRGEYRITTLGIAKICETVIPKIKGERVGGEKRLQ